jgi:hypothetical protein
MRNLQIPQTRKTVEESGKTTLTAFQKKTLKILSTQQNKFGKTSQILDYSVL